MNLSNLKKQQNVLIFTVVLILLAFFSYTPIWKLILSFSNQNIAAGFESSNGSPSGGDWNSTTTWSSTGASGFSSPNDIKLSPTGEIYVADTGNNRVVVFNNDKSASTTYRLGLINVDYIAISTTTNDIYVVDTENNQLADYNVVLATSTIHGGLGLNAPKGIATAPSGEIYIADSGNNRVVVLNSDFSASTTYSVNNPQSVDFDSSGEIYVSDLVDNQVVVLNPDGSASTTFDGGHIAPLYPGSLAVSTSSIIYLADGGSNNRVVSMNDHTPTPTDYMFNFPFDSNGGNESTQTTDISTNADNGIVTNAIWESAGGPDGNGAYYFTGNATNNTYITLTTPAATTTGPFTIIAWASTTATNLNYNTVFSTRGPLEGGLDLIMRNGHFLTTIASIGLNASAGSFVANKWYHIAVVVSTSSFKYYINGTNIYTTSIAGTNAVLFDENHAFHIGTIFNGNEVFEGAISNVEVYNRALSGKEVSLIFNGSKGQIFIPSVSAPKGMAINSAGEVYTLSGDDLIIYNADGTVNDSVSSFNLPNYIPIEGVDYPGQSDDAIIDTNTVTLTQDQNVHDLTLDSGGTLDLNGHTLNVYGDWENSGGTLINNGGTINLAGTGTQKILGENTFDNLVKNTTASSTLLFDNVYTTTINNNLTLFGSTTGKLTISAIQLPGVAPFSYKLGGVEISALGNTRGIAISSSGKILATDSQNNRVMVLDPITGEVIDVYKNIGLDWPIGITVSSSGYIYVVNQYSNSVSVLNPDGTASTTYNAGSFSYPDNIAISPSGYIYVSNNNNTTTILNPDGTASTTIATNAPEGIAFSPSGDIYFSRYGNIEIYNPDGTASTSFNGGYYPDSIAISPSGYIYLGDHYSNSIVVLNPNLTASTTYNTGFSPSSLALSNSGKIYAVDLNNLNIVILNPNGSFFGKTYGLIPGSFAYPSGVTHDSSNNIYVSDIYPYTIQKFDSSGNYIKNFDTSGLGISNYNDESFLATDHSNNIYVTDNSDNLIMKFNSDGDFSTSTDSINYPAGIAVDSSGNMYTTSNGTDLIKMDSSFNTILSTSTFADDSNPFWPYDVALDPTGNYLYVIGGYDNSIIKLNSSTFAFIASTTENMSCPGGISTDSNGNVYVSDTCNYDVVKFSSNLSYITSWGSYGTGDGEFSYPQQTTVDSNGNVYVVEQDNHNVQKFTQLSPASSFNIIHMGASSTASFGYLNVYNSNNTSADTFYCLDGCFDGGANTNWDFGVIPIIHHSHRRATTTTPVIETPAMGGTTEPLIEEASTSTSTSTSTTTPPKIIPPTLPKDFCFTKNLNPGDSSTDVKYLQIFLNTRGFASATSGPETLGSEMDYYGTVTTNSVINFQEYYANDILGPYGATSGTGIFGNQSRKKANDLLGCSVEPNPKPVPPPTPEPQPTPTPTPTPEPTPNPNPTPNPTPNPNPTPAPTPTPTPTPGASTNSLDNLIGGISDTIAPIVRIASSTINTPAGSIVTKLVSTVGLVVGGITYSAALLFANPLTWSESWSIIPRIFGLISEALGIRKKRRPWGTVYDSITKRPLDPAYVTLVDAVTNKPVSSAITDLDGRYGFLVTPGKYKLIAQKTNYQAPSVKMSSLSFDEVYNDIYHGEEITVGAAGEIITKNIPMDPLKFDWNEFTKNKGNMNTFLKGSTVLWARIYDTLFVLGAVIALVALIFAPAPYNIIVAGLYVVAYLLNYVVFKTKKAGTLLEKSTGLPLSFAVVKIYREGQDDSPIAKKIADKYGRYYVLLPQGRYYLKIDKKNDDESYTEVFKSPTVDLKSGIVNESMVL